MEKVPVSQLKSSLARYLDKVKAGASLLVTDRGTAVAVIEPVDWLTGGDEAMKRLILSGHVSPPSRKLGDDFFSTRPAVKDPDASIRRFLAEERAHGR